MLEFFGVEGLGFRVGFYCDLGASVGAWTGSPSVLGILFTFWVLGFLIYEQKGSFFLPRGTGIKGFSCLSGFRASGGWHPSLL